MKTSAIVTGYNDRKSLENIVPVLLTYPFIEIVLAVGGSDGTREYAESIDDPRIRLLFEDSRLGKMQALKRAASEVSSSAVFVVCSDVRFTREHLNTLLENLTLGIGVVIPMVEPENCNTFTTRIGAEFWYARNEHLRQLDKLNRPLHGGELILLRPHLLRNLPDVINDDAYICLSSIERGERTKLAGGVVVSNRVPETIVGLIRQRERVNLGHTELSEMNMKPSVMSRSFRDEPVLFLRVITSLIRLRKSSVFVLPFVIMIESISILLSMRDRRQKRDLLIWPLVN